MTPQDLAHIRAEVMSAFDPDTKYYYHVSPHSYSDFIDGMAWIGILCGAALRVKDHELAGKCVDYLYRILTVGKDARNFAPMQVKTDWVASTVIPGYWYKEKAQAFAGPAGLQFAVDSGAELTCPYAIKTEARMMCFGGWVYGILARYSETLRGHINSMWTAYLILNKKPSSTMMWMCEENPFFSFIAGKKCSVEYPPNTRLVNGRTEMCSTIISLKYAEPCAWIFRRDPFNLYSGSGGFDQNPTRPWQRSLRNIYRARFKLMSLPRLWNSFYFTFPRFWRPIFI